MHQHVRVRSIPRRSKRRTRRRIRPIVDNKRQYEDFQTSSYNTNPLTVSHRSCPSQPETIYTKQSILTSIDVIDQFPKKTFFDTRKENIEKKKTYPKRWLIIIIILVILFILALIGVGIYLIIHFTTNSKSTTTPIPAFLRWNTTGETVAGISGSAGGNSSQLNYPIDLVIDSLGTLYIADFNNNRIQKWLYNSRSGTTVAGANNMTGGSDPIYLKEPYGVDVDSNSNIYIADSRNHRIQLWSKNAASGSTLAGTTSVSSTANNQLNAPCHVVYNENTQTLYIADKGNDRIMKYTYGALTGELVAGRNGTGPSTSVLNQPYRFFFDSPTNSLIIANFGENNIVRWVLGDNSWSLIAGSVNGTPGTSSTLLFGPIGVTLDPMGNVYVADIINSRIQMFNAGQSVGTTIVGVSGVSGSNSTTLLAPYAVRLDNQLNLYVADTGNQRIQKFSRY